MNFESPILVICHGNVARSQFTQALLNQAGATNVISAGTNVKPEKEGVAIKDDGEIARKGADYFLRYCGIDIGFQRRKRVTEEMALKAKLIIVITEKQNLPEFIFKYQAKLVFWNIADPHDMDYHGYGGIIDQIKANVQELTTD